MAIDRGRLVVDMAISDLQALVESMWALRDQAPEAVPLEQVMASQNEADEGLRYWADREGIPATTTEERADAAQRLRESVTERWKEVLAEDGDSQEPATT